jgi:hypothetical protein
MKNLIFLLLSGIIIASCCNDNTQTATVIDINKEKEKVALVLEKYVIANEKQEIDLIHDVWAQDTDIVVFGTNSNEKIIGWEEISKAVQRQFNSFDETYISVRDQIIEINETGNTAWFSEIINYNYVYNGEPVQFEGLRFTGVLEKRGEDWFIVQSHMSIPGSPN